MVWFKNLIFYDLFLLTIFILFVVVFLYKRRKKLDREGWLYIYRTSLGLKIIDKIGGKYKKTLKFFSYVSVILGYILMVTGLYLIFQTAYYYIKFPGITDVIKAPPVFPIFPYFPKVFGLSSFFPELYFIYFIIAIAIVAVVHEFSHGIFARFYKVKIKSTGFAFLGPILGAFVEQDDKDMLKKKPFEQKAILGAGVLANLIVMFLFYFVMIFVFVNFFIPSGAVFNGYPAGTVSTNVIQGIENYPVIDMTNEEIIDLIKNKNIQDDKIGNYNLTEIKIQNKSFYAPIKNLELAYNYSGNLVVFYDSPALKSGFPDVKAWEKAAIVEFNGVKINNYQNLVNELRKYSPGDKVSVKTKYNGQTEDYEVILGEHPLNKTVSFLGINNDYAQEKRGMRKIISFFTFYKDDSTFYEPVNSNILVIFIYNFIWWIVILNLAVALFNMLPLGILDGGRFFYLTILELSGSEKNARRMFKAITYIIMTLFLVLLIVWGVSFFR
ncbi:MAG: site-2 protease family protein [Nanoarchaeota archaeon]